MPPSLAALLFIAGIVGLFVFDYDRKARTSRALWIPVVWLWIIGSREVSIWLATFGVGHSSYAEGVNPSLDGNAIDRNIYLGLLLLGLIVLFRRGRQVSRLLRENLPIVLFLFYCGVSVLWSHYPGVAFKRWTKSVGDVVMILVVLTDRDQFSAIKRLLARTAFTLIPLSALLIKYYPSIGKGFKHYGTAFYVGVTTNKNLLGIICLLFGLATVWRFLLIYRERSGKRRTRQLVGHGILMVINLWLFSMASSSTSLSCFLMISPLILMSGFRMVQRRPWIVHLMVAGIVTVSFCVLFLGVGGSLLEGMGKDSTLTGRTGIWRLALSLTGNPLIGTGFESFWLPGWRRDKLWEAYWWHPNEAHNGYIEVFLNLGWIGVTLLALIIVTGYRKIFITFRRDPDTGRLSLAYFVVCLVYSFTEAGFRMLDPVWFTFLMAIIVAPRVRPTASKSPSEEGSTAPEIDRKLCEINLLV